MIKNTPFIPIKDVIFPGVITTIFIGRTKSIKSLEVALVENNKLLLFLQQDSEEDNPRIPEEIYETGVMVNIIQSSKLPDGVIRVLIEGEKRVKLIKVLEKELSFRADYSELEEIHVDEKEEEALKRKVLESFEEYLKDTNRISPELIISVRSITNLSKLLDLIASNINIELPKRQEILEAIDLRDRAYKIIALLSEEIEVVNLEKKIDTKVRDYMSNLQKSYYLKEKIKAMKEELGEDSGTFDDVDDLRNAVEEAKIPEKIKAKLENEISKLEKMPAYSSEFSVVRNYIETVLELPWSKQTKDTIDIKKAERILNEQHFGLDEVKQRILEFLAVRQLKDNSVSGSILCLIGPPGVGKTSLCKSIAEALGRKFARISLGGIRDEAEVRGHRRTYIGAMPGRIIKELKHVETKNPLMLLDEIDKISFDYRGDPSSALLEVLDPEQNKGFVDNYIDLPFDLSNIFFIATANDASNIPAALRDRLEIIYINSYTDVEKVHISKLYLINKSKEENGLKNFKVNIPENVIYDIISEYTKEAGVRSLKRQFDKIFRKIAKDKIEKNIKQVYLNAKTLKKYLGNPKYLKDKIKKKEGKIGISIGLGWSPVGGSTLDVQSTIMKGKGKLVLTGKLGDVMKESAMVARSYIRSISKELDIQEDKFLDYDVHLHFPEGATPKDGPSAGVAIVTSMSSALTERKVRQDIAMTGEITITGEVLPVGGIKEKVIGAHRAGIREVILPKENEYNIDELPKEVKRQMTFHLVDNYVQVMDKVFFQEA